MKWIEINPEKLPEIEVLGANFKPGTYGYKEKLIGWLGKNAEGIYCDDEYQILENCTHYIDIHKFDI